MNDYGFALFEQHAAKLAGSAVYPDVARQRGYVSADTKAQLEREGFSPAQRRVPGLVIPLWNVLGERVGAQLRPDVPRMLEGRPVKYETRAGDRLVLDVPPAVRDHLGDPSRPLVITEGPIKADAAVSAGLDCVALLGVWAWRGSNTDDGKVALPDWEYVALNDRTVVIAFDSDVMLKAPVYEALRRLGGFLAHRGTNVAYAYLPHGDAGTKIGLDDWLAAGNPATALFDLATTMLKPLAGEPVEAETRESFEDIPDEPGWRALDDLAVFLDRFVAWPSIESRDAVVLWIAHTHVIDALDYTPRLAITSPVRRCAKTRVLELVKRTARQARHSVSMSASYMFRIIEDSTPTLLIDEADTVFGTDARDETSESLRGLINAGFERGATVGRIVGDGAGMQPKDFAVFAPVAVAGIGDCIPETVRDRAVNLKMRRRGGGEPVEAFRRRRNGAEAETLRRRLGSWAETATFTIEAAFLVDPALPDGVTDRLADTWEPLIVVAAAAGGDWPERARAACIRLGAEATVETGTIGRLLSDLAAVFVEDRQFSVTLAERLNALDESPWGGWNRNAKTPGIAPRDLARLLGELDIKSHNVRIADEQRKGYELADFADVFARYLTPEEGGQGQGEPPSCTPGTSVPTSQDPSGPNSMASEQGKCGWDGGTATGDGEGVGRTHGTSHPLPDDEWEEF